MSRAVLLSNRPVCSPNGLLADTAFGKPHVPARLLRLWGCGWVLWRYAPVSRLTFHVSSDWSKAPVIYKFSFLSARVKNTDFRAEGFFACACTANVPGAGCDFWLFMTGAFSDVRCKRSDVRRFFYYHPKGGPKEH